MPNKPRRLILIGMMGSGKTTIGQLLARATGWPYVDNDEALTAATDLTAAELATHGERAVRRAEHMTLTQLLATPQPAIVAAAAGTILDEASRRAIKAAGTVIWLKARPETLAARVSRSDDSHRPWLTTDALAWLTSATRERESLYESVADIVVDVDEITPPEAVDFILSQVPP